MRWRGKEDREERGWREMGRNIAIKLISVNSRSNLVGVVLGKNQ